MKKLALNSRSVFSTNKEDIKDNRKEILRCGKQLIERIRRGNNINEAFNYCVDHYGFHRTEYALKLIKRSFNN